MYIPLIIFLISLVGMTGLLWRKLSVLRRFNALNNSGFEHEFFFDVPDLENVQVVVTKHLKKYGYVTLVATVRVYVRSQKVADALYKALKNQAVKLNQKYLSRKKKDEDPQEVSRFLKTVSEYKTKLRHIKEQVKKEEGIE